jgi:DNA polymerase IIIc chi subunit
MTTRIDFYILPDVELTARARFTCRLAYRAVATGLAVHVHADSAAECEELDALMWEYPRQQFLPHCLAGAPGADSAPVTLGHGSPPAGRERMLINLSESIPEFFSRFERVAEIVIEHQRPQLREHYRYYRNRGYALHDHHMGQWEEQ